MTETHGTDSNETIAVKGLEFSAQLTIGGAKWLERQLGEPITRALGSLLPADGQDFDVTKVSYLLTALYLSRHAGADPKEAESKIDTLDFADMMEVMERARPVEFEAKNSPKAPPETEAPEKSTGPASSTT